jgi:two-component system, OmpR family, sensor histidine kinase BaeS
MRKKMIVAFSIVVLATIASLVLILRNGAANEVRMFMNRGGMVGSDSLVTALETYYGQNGSFEGAGTLLIPMGANAMHGQGMGGGRGMSTNLMLANPEGLVLADSLGNMIGHGIPPAELTNGIILKDNRGKTIGYLLVEDGSVINQSAASPLLARLNTAALQASLFAGLIALILALFFAWRLIAPIRELTRAARTLAAGDLTHRVPVNGNDEMAQLGAAFNQMAESLQKSEEARRNMTADIAHELRTPLSVQRAQLEALQDGMYPLTKENLQPVLDQTGQLAHLVEDLRTLALSDAGELTLDNRQIDFTKLIRKVLDGFQTVASLKNQTIKFLDSSNGEKIILGDAIRMEQVLNNLIGNAIRHTPDSGKVSLTMESQPGNIILRIKDSGDGIPEEAIPYIFDRFYRADQSRSRQDGGSGLGLAIARRLVELHQGTLTAANSPDGGAVFTLTLPHA